MGLLRIGAPTLMALTWIAGCGGDDVPDFDQRDGDAGVAECTEETPVPTRRRDSGSGGGDEDSGSGGEDAGMAEDAGADGMGGGGKGEDAGGGGGDMDAGRPRTGSGCDPGEVCLRGRCYPGCSGDGDCLAREMCLGGVCVARTMPAVDAGMEDAGRVDPCAMVTCDMGLVCHPASGTCVQCSDSNRDACGGSTSICDVARGECRAWSPGVCSACNVAADCAGIVPAGGDGRCELLTSPSLERVCVIPCTDMSMCPRGQRCDSDGYCVPQIGSCTNWRAAATGLSCDSDDDCVPLGTTPFSGTCSGTCRHPCGVLEDCPDSFNTCQDGMFCATI